MKRKADFGDVSITLNADHFVQEDTLERDKTPPRDAANEIAKIIRDKIIPAVDKEIIDIIRERLKRDGRFKKIVEENNLVIREHGFGSNYGLAASDKGLIMNNNIADKIANEVIAGRGLADTHRILKNMIDKKGDCKMNNNKIAAELVKLAKELVGIDLEETVNEVLHQLKNLSGMSNYGHFESTDDGFDFMGNTEGGVDVNGSCHFYDNSDVQVGSVSIDIFMTALGERHSVTRDHRIELIKHKRLNPREIANDIAKQCFKWMQEFDKEHRR